MKLQFYNSFSRKGEDLRPLKEGRLGIYACGPTVYDAPHLGHARSAVLFDVFRRFFETQNCEVTLVRNITDIDDKILCRAQETGTDYRAIAARYCGEYDDVMSALNVRPPQASPRATAYIQPCQEIIARIVHHDHAYRVGNSVYFSTGSCPWYGRLSRRSNKPSRLSAALPENSDKRHPDDFALWKGRKDGEPFWDSPWGPGRPGWHIECTAMSHSLLGTPFDIHGGGRDLIFPHHENELAQSIAAFGTPPTNLWIHHGMVTVGQTKMAKSKGNAPPLRALLETYHPEAVRLFLLTRHYRRELPFTESALQIAARQLDRLYALARRLQTILGNASPGPRRLGILWQRFHQHMASDGNIPGGLTEVFTAARELNRALDSTVSIRGGSLWQAVMSTASDIGYICRHILGVLEMPVEDYAPVRRPAGQSLRSRSEIDRLVAQRLAARQVLDWGRADRLQRILAKNGIRLRDNGGETVWRQGKRQGQVKALKSPP